MEKVGWFERRFLVKKALRKALSNKEDMEAQMNLARAERDHLEVLYKTLREQYRMIRGQKG